MSPYDPADWHDFFLTAGTAAAALTGLLFVALSIHLDRILGHTEHRFRARGNFFGLTVVMVMALIVLVPTLDGRWLGALLILTNAAAATLTTWHFRGILPSFFGASAGFQRRVTLAYVLLLIGAIGGVSVILGTGGGLAWTGVESIGMLLVALLGAWSLLVGVAQNSDKQVAEPPSAGRQL